MMNPFNYSNCCCTICTLLVCLLMFPASTLTGQILAGDVPTGFLQHSNSISSHLSSPHTDSTVFYDVDEDGNVDFIFELKALNPSVDMPNHITVKGIDSTKSICGAPLYNFSDPSRYSPLFALGDTMTCGVNFHFLMDTTSLISQFGTFPVGVPLPPSVQNSYIFYRLESTNGYTFGWIELSFDIIGTASSNDPIWFEIHSAMYEDVLNDIIEVESPLNDGLAVYPNPSSGSLNLSLKKGKLAKAELFDCSGRLCKSWLHSNSIDTSQLSPGSYFVKVVDDAGNTFRKYVILF